MPDTWKKADKWQRVPSRSEDSISVVILASGEVEHAGIRSMLESQAGFHVLTDAGDADVVILSAPEEELPGFLRILGDAMDAEAGAGFQDMRDPVPALLLIAAGVNDESAAALRGIPWRAYGILPRNASRKNILAALTALSQGLLVGSPGSLERMLRETPETKTSLSDGNHAASRGGKPDQMERLTEREKEVLQLLALGLANKEIASELSISDHTAKFHISSIYRKFDVTNRVEAVRLGIRDGLISL